MSTVTRGGPALPRLLALAIVAGLAVPAAAAGLSGALARLSPDTATALYGGNTSALNRNAAVLLADAPKVSAEERATVRGLMDRSFASTLLNPGAYRLMGVAVSPTLEGDQVRRWMQAASETSSRDSGAHIWLAQDAARRGDPAQTMNSVDYALRSSFATSDTLMPILVTGLTDPMIQKRIPQLVHEKVFWTPRFLEIAAATSKRPDIVADVVIASGGFPDRAKENGRLLVRRLAGEGYYDDAVTFASFMDKKARGVAGSVAVTEATIDEQLAPISWMINPEVGTVVALDDGRLGLTADVARDRTAVIASKLVYGLPRGARITGSVQFAERSAADALQIDAGCASSNGTRFVAVGRPIAASTTDVQNWAADLPFECSPVEIRLRASSSLDGSGNEVTVSNTAIRR